MMNKKKSDFLSQFSICIIIFLYFVVPVRISKVDATTEADEEIWGSSVGPLVPKDQRRSLVSTEYGEISAVKLNAGTNGTYHIQFITLEPNALFLPVILNADMVIYVQTGSGRVTWINDDGDENEETEENEVILASWKRRRGVVIQRGDVYRMPPGTVFFIQSSSEPETQKLQICAIFASSENSVIGPYSSIRDMVLGFDKKILQVAFQVPEEIVEEITAAKKPPAIVHGVPTSVKTSWEVEAKLIEVLFGRKYNTLLNINKKKKKKEKKSKEKKSSSSSTYNILNGARDVQNCNGWMSTVTTKQLKSLQGSNIGISMVNLSKAAMMGPHWNPMATEIGIVLEGQGVVHVVCPSIASGTECKTVTRATVKEGDVFVVPKFYPAAQISFNNGSFVFVGFTTTNRRNHQFLAGSRSVLQILEKQVLAVSFNVSNSTIGGLLAPQHESVILECISCAEEEERLVQEEIEKAKEEARKKEEEEMRKKEEEKRKQEEEARKKEEEKKRKEEEEARKKEEEEAKKKKEEEEKRRKEEEEVRKKEEEEKKRKEEDARKRKEEEKEKREEEEARKRAEEEKKRKEEEEARKRREEEIRRQEEEIRRKEEEVRKREEEEKKRKEQEEETRKREEEEARRKGEEAARRREEAAKREEEQARRQEDEQAEEEEKAIKREEEEGEKKEEEARKRREQAQQEEEKQRQEEARKKEKEEAIQRKEEEMRKKEAAREEAAARQQEEEMEKQAQQEEEKTRQEEATRKEEEEARQTKEQTQQEEEKRQKAVEEEEARRKEEEELRQREEQAQQEKEMRRKEAAREKEVTRQQEEEFWHGGPREGRNFWEKMQTS